MSKSKFGRFDRFTEISEFGDAMRNLLRPGIPLILVVVSVMVAILFFTGQSGWMGLLWMGAGTGISLFVWRNSGIGLPLIPMLMIQHLVVYGLPVFARNEVVVAYPDALITQSGIEIFIFMITSAIAWRGAMHIFVPKRGFSYVLKILASDSSRNLRVFALGLMLATTLHEVLFSTGLLDLFYSLLPSGSWSIMTATLNAAGMSGTFLTAMAIGSGEANTTTKTTFWLLLTASCLLLASSFLLSSTTNLVGAATIGLFWGSGRVPWRFLAVVVVSLSFLHIGKFEMRERYWQKSQEDIVQNFSLADMPAHYTEWVQASYEILVANESENAGPSSRRKDSKNDSMINRVNNLQNLLYAIDAVEIQRIPILGGATYTIIPPLLIPRILWPEKPRTHEGQIMLNTHFGRQSLKDSFMTYIAWGLLPEAVGNFGTIWGGVLLGLGCGTIFAWLEVKTAYKPLLSLEGLVTFALFIGIAVSFEMVASVLITSLFQSVTTIVLACSFFVHRTSHERPNDEADEEESA